MLLISRSSRFSGDWHSMQQQKIWNGSLFACCGLEASLLVDKTSSGKRTRKCCELWLVFSNVDLCITLELVPIVFEQVEDNNPAREVVRLPAVEGPEVWLSCLSFQRRFHKDFLRNKFLKDSPLLMPAAEDRLEVELHNLSPSLQVHSLNLFIVGWNTLIFPFSVLITPSIF